MCLHFNKDPPNQSQPMGFGSVPLMHDVQYQQPTLQSFSRLDRIAWWVAAADLLEFIHLEVTAAVMFQNCDSTASAFPPCKQPPTCSSELENPTPYA